MERWACRHEERTGFEAPRLVIFKVGDQSTGLRRKKATRRSVDRTVADRSMTDVDDAGDPARCQVCRAEG